MTVRKNVNFITSLKFNPEDSKVVFIFSNTCLICKLKSLIPTIRPSVFIAIFPDIYGPFGVANLDYM